VPRKGDVLFITKPIGIGDIFGKRDLISVENAALMIEQMSALNTIGALLGKENQLQ
jgi:selenophosphate synthase